jgi:multidrug efflux pump subunit AcrB
MAMISGAVVSTALTLVAVPLLYYELHHGRQQRSALPQHG